MKWLCADKQLQLVAVCLAAPQLLCIQNCRAYEYISNSFPFFFFFPRQTTVRTTTHSPAVTKYSSQSFASFPPFLGP